VLDTAHIGDIHGAFGSIKLDDIAPRTRWRDRLRTLLAIIGPGLIVMVGDNDAGAFGTYTQAGQNYGTGLLWTLAAGTGALCESGDGAETRRGDACGPWPADP
jgi:hypothetical protein